MSRMLKTTLKLSTAALSLFVVAGCATDAGTGNFSQSELQRISDQAAQAEQTAEASKAEAQSAMDAATKAQQMAQDAQGTAKSAQFTADQNSQKIDRMFKKSMYK